MISKFVLGTVQFGLKYGINHTEKPSSKEVFKILETAQAKGIQEVDTAAAYGHALEVLSEYPGKNQADFKIVTKVVLETDNFLEQLELNLNRLKVAQVEGCYLHRFADIAKPNLFAEVKKAKERGLLKKFGVSIYSIEDLNFVKSDSEIDMIQIPFNIFDQDENKIETLKEAQRNNKQIYARSAFLQGLFFMSPAQLPVKLKALAQPLANLQKVSEENEFNLSSLCLKFVLDQECIDKVIIGVENEAQLLDNLKAIPTVINDEIRSQLNGLSVKDKVLINPLFWN